MASTSQGPQAFTDTAVLVRAAEANRSLWGDEDSGQVADLWYGRGERISGVMFILGPGQSIKDSHNWKPVPMRYEHRVFYVVRGTLAIHDPETGDVAVAGPGEAITWRGGQFHFAYNLGSGEVVVVDWFAPVERPADVSERDWSRAKRTLHTWQGGRYDLLGSWPDRRSGELAISASSGAPTTVGVRDALHLIHSRRRSSLVSILASSPHLTVGTLSLPPGTRTDPERHPGDEVVHAVGGRLHVHLPDSGQWFEMQSHDCLFIPGGTPHEYWSYGDDTVHAVFGVAPGYRWSADPEQPI